MDWHCFFEACQVFFPFSEGPPLCRHCLSLIVWRCLDGARLFSPPAVLQNMLFPKDLEQDGCSPWKNNALGRCRRPYGCWGQGVGSNGDLWDWFPKLAPVPQILKTNPVKWVESFPLCFSYPSWWWSEWRGFRVKCSIGSGWLAVGSPAAESTAVLPCCSFLFPIRKRQNELLMSEKGKGQGKKQ